MLVMGEVGFIFDLVKMCPTILKENYTPSKTIDIPKALPCGFKIDVLVLRALVLYG